ncbi:MAG: NADH-quinone oxidoreductase subunit C [Bacteroidota bacterium]
MTVPEISEKIKVVLPDAVREVKAEGVIDPFIKINPAPWKELARFLHDDPEMKFDFLMCLSGMDYGKNILGVVYHLYSMTKKHKLTVKIEVPVDNAVVPSVDSVWGTANWHEREAYDMFGVKFTGHPDLRRILLPDDWEGYPLRKDYKVPEYYQGMKVPY